jgi:hypothetical protein
VRMELWSWWPVPGDMYVGDCWPGKRVVSEGRWPGQLQVSDLGLQWAVG